jgi:hypothetical protein
MSAVEEPELPPTTIERGAGRRHIHYFVIGTFQRPGQVTESKPTADFPGVAEGRCGCRALHLLPIGEKVPEGRMRGAKPLAQSLPTRPLIASHTLGTSPRRGEE